MSTDFPKQKWASDLLIALGNTTPSPILIDFVWAWSQMESGAGDTSRADYNPLNTTLVLGGSTPFNNANVQNYQSYQQGKEATMATLSNGLYPTLFQTLQTNVVDTSVVFGLGIAGDLSVWVSGKRDPIDTTYVDTIYKIMQEHEGNTGSTTMQENAVFVSDVNQFIVGFSVEMCVAATGALIYHSTKPGSSNPYTVNDVQQMMLQYYARETGSDTSQSGLSLAQEQDMYTRMGLKFVTLPISASSLHASDMANVTNALKSGFLVAICGAETGFIYLNGDTVPYAWTPTGNHCIAATGLDSTGNFIVRDTASLVQADNFSPDTAQVYDNSKMNLISGLAIIPSWLASVAPPVPTSNENQITQFTDIWNASAPLFHAQGLPDPAMTTGLAKEWFLYMQKYFIGPPVTPEFNSVDWNGNPIIVQIYSCGMGQWDNGKARFWIADKEVTF